MKKIIAGLLLLVVGQAYGMSEAIKSKALLASLNALAVKAMGFGKNPFKENPMTVGLAGQFEDSGWIVVEDAWEYKTEDAKLEYVKLAINAFRDAGCAGGKYPCGYDISALTIRQYSTGKELAYCEKPWETAYYQETWMGLEGGPNDPRPKLPQGLSWAPLY
jgi:hypothetical protein